VVEHDPVDRDLLAVGVDHVGAHPRDEPVDARVVHVERDVLLHAQRIDGHRIGERLGVRGRRRGAGTEREHGDGEYER
jgi:hypothetical protein